ncbi:Heavy metal-associated isoprenylated plant protein 36 [Bienertia sinuspersici]
MAAPSDNFQGPLKYQTWTLRVPYTVKVARKGVYTLSIDSQLHKVTVTGNIDAQTLLQKLSKSGKPAELWPDNINTPGKPENLLKHQVMRKERQLSPKSKRGEKCKEYPKEDTGKATQEGGKKKDKKSAENHSNPPNPKPLNEGEKAPPLDSDKPLPLENAGGNPQVNGNNNGNKKKKNKNKGNNGNPQNDGNPNSPSPASFLHKLLHQFLQKLLHQHQHQHQIQFLQKYLLLHQHQHQSLQKHLHNTSTSTSTRASRWVFRASYGSRQAIQPPLNDIGPPPQGYQPGHVSGLLIILGL